MEQNTLRQTSTRFSMKFQRMRGYFQIPVCVFLLMAGVLFILDQNSIFDPVFIRNGELALNTDLLPHQVEEHIDDFKPRKIKNAGGHKKVPRSIDSRNDHKPKDMAEFREKHKGKDAGYFFNIAKHRTKLHNKIVRQFTLKKEDRHDEFINLHRYGYVLNSRVCRGGKFKFVILVHSKFNNFIKRARIRSTYAKNSTVLGVKFAVAFILGRPNIDELYTEENLPHGGKKRPTPKEKQAKWNETLKNLEVEGKVFNDIVMGNFTDSYRNLTVKHIFAYDWVLKNCRGMLFVLKVDDDIMVNTYRIARLVQQSTTETSRKGLLICDVPQTQYVIRKDTAKWFVSKEEYPFRFYPPWCKGYGVLMTRDVCQKLYRGSSHMRNFWIDDVYVTGFLAWRAGVQVRNLRQKQATVTRNEFRPRDVNALFIWAPFNKQHSQRQYWKAMVAAQEKRWSHQNRTAQQTLETKQNMTDTDLNNSK